MAAAVVVHGGRVLLVRRGVPEVGLVWQFPAGKAEAGESDAEAAVREAREETGLPVGPVGWLGERVHPVTGRWTGYVACQVLGRRRRRSPRSCGATGTTWRGWCRHGCMTLSARSWMACCGAVPPDLSTISR
ncbi:NUDIX hydrolase [Dactylosporangium sp. NPDC005555]|uniref:NUDIX hydrolase n=1 Tax=Dactylosporangium sp. NPDC005555 TaxID=3154889 RepID=UPI0033A2784F